jgi:PiT family inorganic phosphate transporter
MEFGFLLLGVTLIFGLYMAFNIGANDVANAMGTSVGSHALTIKQAIIVAAIFEFAGAFLVGGNVTSTMKKGIVDPMIFSQTPMVLAVGMTCALLAAAIWLQFATWKGLPVSTTHSIVGAIVGFGVVAHGLDAVKWTVMGSIVASWVISPVVGGILAYLTFRVIRSRILNHKDPVAATRTNGPWLVGMVLTILTLTFIYKGLKNLKLGIGPDMAIPVALGVGLVAALLTRAFLSRLDASTKDRDLALKIVERAFAWLQIITACFMAFAHGSNDVANAIGPAAAVVSVVKEGVVATKSVVPFWLLGIGGIGIVVGLATMGKRVIETVGKNITEVTPTRGFAAEFGAATTVLIGSRLGLPLSTTHVLVGAVIGVGFARGIAALNMRVIRNIAVSWIITVPAGAVLAGLFFLVARGFIPA